MSFDTVAELDLVVSDEELRNVQKQIESELGAVEIGVTDGGAMSAQTGGGGASASRNRRRSMRLDQGRNKHLEDISLYLEEIEDHLAEGGLGGGGGGMLAEIFGVAGETAGDVAVESGSTVADAVSDVLTGTAASALGNTISSAITNSELGIEDTTLSVDPSPLPVAPNPLPVEGGGGEGNGFPDDMLPTPEVDDYPTLPIPDPDDLPTLPVPDILNGNKTIGVDAPESIPVEDIGPLAVEDVGPLPVENVGPLPVEDVGPLPVEDIEPITVAVDISGQSGGAGGGSDRGAIQRAGGVLDDVSARVAEVITGRDAPPSITEPLGEGGTMVGRPGETIGRFFDTTNPLTSGGFGSGSGSSSGGGTQLDVSVTHSPTYRVDVDPRKLDRMASNIVSEIERNVDRDIDKLEREIRKLQSDFDDLKRDIRRNR